MTQKNGTTINLDSRARPREIISLLSDDSDSDIMPTGIKIPQFQKIDDIKHSMLTNALGSFTKSKSFTRAPPTCPETSAVRVTALNNNDLKFNSDDSSDSLPDTEDLIESIFNRAKEKVSINTYFGPESLF